MGNQAAASDYEGRQEICSLAAADLGQERRGGRKGGLQAGFGADCAWEFSSQVVSSCHCVATLPMPLLFALPLLLLPPTSSRQSHGDSGKKGDFATPRFPKRFDYGKSQRLKQVRIGPRTCGNKTTEAIISTSQQKRRPAVLTFHLKILGPQTE